MKFSTISLLLLFAVFYSATSDNVFSSIFSSFGKKKPASTPAPSFAKSASSSTRCDMTTRQCNNYECCNSDQTCIRNRCFPRLPNCPVLQDQCGKECCKRGWQCRNGKCTR